MGHHSVFESTQRKAQGKGRPFFGKRIAYLLFILLGTEWAAQGKLGSALKLMHDTLISRRHRSWNVSYEKLLLRYIQMCVPERRSVKDVLSFCRHFCSVSPLISHAVCWILCAKRRRIRNQSNE